MRKRAKPAIGRARLERFVRSRDWYQSYEFLEQFGVRALSDSEAKFRALRLGDLAGKTVLDIGCNAGYLTFRAIEEGAALAVGVDMDLEGIETANAIRLHIRRVPTALFVWSEVMHFLTELRSRFDVVIGASVGHYLDLPSLLRRLAPDEVELVALELPYVPGSKDLHVSRGGRIVIPGDGALERIAAGHGFSCRRVGESEKLDADERAVFHFRPARRTRKK